MRFYIDACHGLGNRLRAVGSAAAVARKTGRELVIVWEPDHHCECRFSELFDYDGEVIEEGFASKAGKNSMHVYNYMEVEEGAEKNALIETDDKCDVYARSAYVLNSPHSHWEEENRFLRSLKPVAHVQDLIDSLDIVADLSVHVRMVGGQEYEYLTYESADNWTEEGHEVTGHWRRKSHFSHFMKRIDTLISEGEVESLFLAADKPETYAEFEERYGDRVEKLPRELYDRSAEQLRYALADAILLGRSSRLLGSTWSSFSELAMRLSPVKMKIEMSGKDF